jgi:hypothetical protein
MPLVFTPSGHKYSIANSFSWCILPVQQTYETRKVLPLLKGKYTPAKCKWMTFHTVYACHIFQCYQYHFLTSWYILDILLYMNKIAWNTELIRKSITTKNFMAFMMVLLLAGVWLVVVRCSCQVPRTSVNWFKSTIKLQHKHTFPY